MLLVRPSPVLGESWASYLRHCAARNSYESIQHMAKMMGVTTRNLTHADPRTFGQKYRLPLHAVDSELEILHSRRRRPTSMARSLRTRVCTACLGSGLSRLPSVWEQPMSIVCNLHRVLLLDRCLSCDSEISTFRPRSQFCLCGANLGGAPTRPAPNWIETVETVFGREKLEYRCLTFAEESRVEISAWGRLGAFALLRNAPVLPGRRLYIDDILGSAPLFESWPDVFVSEVSKLVETGWSERWRLFSKLGGRRSSSIGNAFKAAVLKVGTSSIRTSMRAQPLRRKRSATDFRRDVEVAPTAEQLGVSTIALVRLLNKQRSALEPPVGLGRYSVRMPEWREAVASFAAATGTIIHAKEARDLLGCSRLAVQRLSSEGLIRVQGTNVRSTMISSAAANAILGRMQACAAGKVSRTRFRVCFSHLISVNSAASGTLRMADLVASIESGELLLYVRRGSGGKRLDDFYCKLADIKAWRRSHHHTRGSQSS